MISSMCYHYSRFCNCKQVCTSVENLGSKVSAYNSVIINPECTTHALVYQANAASADLGQVQQPRTLPIIQDLIQVVVSDLLRSLHDNVASCYLLHFFLYNFLYLLDGSYALIMRTLLPGNGVTITIKILPKDSPSTIYRISSLTRTFSGRNVLLKTSSTSNRFTPCFLIWLYVSIVNSGLVRLQSTMLPRILNSVTGGQSYLTECNHHLLHEFIRSFIADETVHNSIVRTQEYDRWHIATRVILRRNIRVLIGIDLYAYKLI